MVVVMMMRVVVVVVIQTDLATRSTKSQRQSQEHPHYSHEVRKQPPERLYILGLAFFTSKFIYGSAPYIYSAHGNLHTQLDTLRYTVA